MKTVVTVLLCIRDGEEYMNFFNEMFSKIEKENKDSISFEYFIYENNSKDKTKKYIDKFLRNRNGKSLKDDLMFSKMYKNEIKLSRGRHMARLRNKLKLFHQELKSDYVLIIDSDVVILPNTIPDLINTIKNDKGNIVMVSPYGMCYDVYRRKTVGIKGKKKRGRIHYYDSFAVISNEGIGHKENINTCLFKSCVYCRVNRKNKGCKLEKKYLWDDDKLIKVKSCFGSISLIKTDVYNKSKWGKTICEHHSFCEEIRKHGDIVINPLIRTFTCKPEHRNYKKMEDLLKYKFEFESKLK